MTKRISLFNHKGGVSKTTTTFNLGWKLAEKRKTVLLVDADPQCNLTGMIMGYKGVNEFEKFYQAYKERNLMYGLSPAFDSKPEPIIAIECVPVSGISGLYVLPGHIDLSGYEVTLGISQQLSGSIQTLQNLPGSLSYLLEKTAENYGADYILVDMNPSLSSINQNLLMTSDFFVVPTSPDYFSVMAIDSLSRVLTRWCMWADQAASLPVLKSATYPFPRKIPIFLGTIIQKYRPRSGEPAKAFQKWIEEIEYSVRRSLLPVLQRNSMVLPQEKYHVQKVDESRTLELIPDFNSLIAKSQKYHVPIFCLSPKQLELQGVALTRTLKSQSEFDRLFSDLAEKIIGLTA